MFTARMAGLVFAAALVAPALSQSTETFDHAAPGKPIAELPGWFNTPGERPATVSTSGIAGSKGVAPGHQGFNWTAHTFHWTDLRPGDSITIGMDFQADDAGQFDDDRVGWAVEATANTNSSNHFGVQLDTKADHPGGVVGYWKIGSKMVYRPLLDFASAGIHPAPNAWYRLRATFRKLPGGAAAIDVTLQALDGSGAPTGRVFSGSLPDTSALPAGDVPPTSLFSSPASPMYKNFSALRGNADNAYYSGTVRSGQAAPAAPASGASATPTPPAANPVLNVTASVGDGEVRLTWASLAQGTRYTIRQSTASGSGYRPIASDIRSTGATIRNLKNGTTYYYIISATDSDGRTVDSSELSVTPGRATP